MGNLDRFVREIKMVEVVKRGQMSRGSKPQLLEVDEFDEAFS